MKIRKPREYHWISLALVIGICVGYIISSYIFPKYKESISDSSTSISRNEVVVVNRSCDDIYVDINGAVHKPGIYCLNDGSIWKDAVEKAGGYSKNYAVDYVRSRVNLAQRVTDGQKIYIPFDKESKCSVLDFTQRVSNILGRTDSDERGSCISINSASKEELTNISGVGDSTAQRIIDNRSYKTIEDIKNVSGIGEATFEKMKSQICL